MPQNDIAPLTGAATIQEHEGDSIGPSEVEHPLLMLAMIHLLTGDTQPSVWIVGETWVRFEDGEYTVDADERASWGEVRDLLIRENWAAVEWLA